MSSAQNIISKFGGIRPCAAAVGKPPSTVQSWRDAGHIPAKHQRLVLNAAREHGVNLSPDDFFEGEGAEAAQ